MSENHGTYARYQVHLKRGETPCAECKSAAAAYQREWRSGEGATKQARLARADQVRGAAMRELARRHPDELLAIMRGEA